MESFQRPQVDTLVKRLAEPPRHIIALFGPRQTGKTTIARQALAQTDLPSRYLAIDEPDPADPPFLYDETAVTFPATSQRERDTQWLVRQWEAARTEAERFPRGAVLVLDEVQKIPDWSETVKGLWDADRLRDCPLRVVILGSAPLLMQSGLSESLAGRFETIRVSHWSFAEMSAAFDFDLPKYLYFGAYPGAAPLVRDPDRWRDLHPRRPRGAEHRARPPGHDPRGQAGPPQAPLRAGRRLLRADPVLHQDAGPASRRREHDHPGALSRPAGQGRPARRPAEVQRQPRLAGAPPSPSSTCSTPP